MSSSLTDSRLARIELLIMSAAFLSREQIIELNASNIFLLDSTFLINSFFERVKSYDLCIIFFISTLTACMICTSINSSYFQSGFSINKITFMSAYSAGSNFFPFLSANPFLTFTTLVFGRDVIKSKIVFVCCGE